MRTLISEHIYLTGKGMITVALKDWNGLSYNKRDILEYLNSVGAINKENAEHIDNIAFGLKNVDLRLPLTGLWQENYIEFA